MLFPYRTLNCRGRIVDLSQPIVMGILNITPDSFYDGGQYQKAEKWRWQIQKMITEGVDIIDLGGMSSRPGAEHISAQEEWRRLEPALAYLRTAYPDQLISVDTFRTEVASQAIEFGAHIINDISGFRHGNELPALAAQYKCPYILMHMKGSPAYMQTNPSYKDVTVAIMDFFIEKLDTLRALGLTDIILDPGFGFGKTIEHNFQLLRELDSFQILEYPILAGLSRKSMIYKSLNITAEASLSATSALHMVALEKGARILRVHDVKEAQQCISLWKQLQAKDLK